MSPRQIAKRAAFLVQNKLSESTLKQTIHDYERNQVKIHSALNGAGDDFDRRLGGGLGHQRVQLSGAAASACGLESILVAG